MDYILHIVLTVLSSDKEPKEIELRLPYSSRGMFKSRKKNRFFI